MTPAELLNRLPALREIFPQPIIQEWSIAEYLAGMKATEKHLVAVLNRWKADTETESVKMETVSNFGIFDL